MADAAGATTASLSVMVDDDTLGLLGLRGGAAGASARWATYPADDVEPAGVGGAHRAPAAAGRPRRDPGASSPTSSSQRHGRALAAVPAAHDRGAHRRRHDAVVPQRPRGRRRRAGVLPDHGGLLRPGARAHPGRGDRRPAAREAHASWPRPAPSSPAASTTSRPCATSRSSRFPTSPTGARSRWRRTGSCAPSRSPTATPPRSSWPWTSSSATRRTRTPRPAATRCSGPARACWSPRSPTRCSSPGAQDEEHLAMLRDLALYSGLTVPLRAEGRVLGHDQLGQRRDRPPLLGGRHPVRARTSAAGPASRSTTRCCTASCARSPTACRRPCAPRPLPELPGWQLGATYSSAGRASVGGDFYDVIPLRDGRVALAIGDVMGRGVTAAAAMSQIRAALRALVAVDPDPRTVMTRLDLLYERFPSDQLVTLVYALADPDLDQLVMSCAGHPAPIVVRADGTAEFVHGGRRHHPRRRGGRPACGRRAVPARARRSSCSPTDCSSGAARTCRRARQRLLETYRTLLPEPTAEDLEPARRARCVTPPATTTSRSWPPVALSDASASEARSISCAQPLGLGLEVEDVADALQVEPGLEQHRDAFDPGDVVVAVAAGAARRCARARAAPSPRRRGGSARARRSARWRPRCRRGPRRSGAGRSSGIGQHSRLLVARDLSRQDT